MESSTGSESFDEYADDYNAALEQGLSVSGESKDFFAAGRVAWLARCLRGERYSVARVVDFGCGTGSATPFLLDQLQAEQLTGIDVSERSLAVARETYGDHPAVFGGSGEFPADATADLVFTNGVFHHIPPDERPAAFRDIHARLKDGGYLAFWENNPWNPGTRYVMSKIPFDRDAIMVWPRQARRLAASVGLQVVRFDFQFIFPRVLGFLRPLEPCFSPFPLGAQYQMLCIKRG
ncbi:Trans-aconitate 2-methyltransferase [Planctomycetes bacterium Pan216]|uniref:Trans-aconitate 2-methyltransferase n=1 Tax=Kolteria novifilia TaxID=2527975 RepID=A0A518B1H1_9BACT|nr:Trans-aconitate 2-methyltransferase [Planctomycetes bacterium Pan216]